MMKRTNEKHIGAAFCRSTSSHFVAHPPALHPYNPNFQNSSFFLESQEQFSDEGLWIKDITFKSLRRSLAFFIVKFGEKSELSTNCRNPSTASSISRARNINVFYAAYCHRFICPIKKELSNILKFRRIEDVIALGLFPPVTCCKGHVRLSFKGISDIRALILKPFP
ncbi:hypothetical protein CDAR_611681 [Caerostris darwini]|uniref:Uncharacterized protein n=1 Tax=Caerostris darwini TaxID=1538125 RepID=A0AAV4U2W8_9ARAC|nr:hypothetical protein CDAR_611681 [Caerostris darwini]